MWNIKLVHTHPPNITENLDIYISNHYLTITLQQNQLKSTKKTTINKGLELRGGKKYK